MENIMFFNHMIKTQNSFNLCSLLVLVIAYLVSCSANKISDTYSPMEVSKISNLESILQENGALTYLNKGSHCEGLKIAVLDNGTSNLTSKLGRTVPDNVKTLNVDYSDNSGSNVHGVVLLETISAICSGSNTYDPSIPGPTLYLYNTQGLPRLFEAIDKVIENDIDIVVYAQTWELGGNLDGQGFINKKVNEAIANGTVWFNAIGNYKNKTFYSSVRPTNIRPNVRHQRLNKAPSIALPYENDSLRIEVDSDFSSVMIKLGWSAFSQSFEDTSDTDLDMYLEDEDHKLVGKSTFIQNDSGKQHTSRHPQEILNLILSKGTYYLHITTKTPGKFTENKYNMWVALVSDAGIRFLDTDDSNSGLVFIPADNPKTISVISTDCHCEYESSLVKDYNGDSISWNVATSSKIEYSDFSSFIGSSTATAVSAAIFGLYASSILHDANSIGDLNLKALADSFVEQQKK